MTHTAKLVLVGLVFGSLCLCPGCESDGEELIAPPGNSNNNSNSNPDGPDGGNGSSTIEGCQFPVAELLTANSYTLENGSFKVVNANHTVYQVFGYSFSVGFAGSLKELGIKVPENGTYTVRVYNAEIGKDDILMEAEVTVNNTDWNYVPIDPLALDPDITYMTAVYFVSKPDEQETQFFHIPDFTYPAEYGDITIIGYALNSEIGIMPKPEPKNSQTFNIFNGLVDFCFEAS
jgi:hypothetical protein